MSTQTQHLPVIKPKNNLPHNNCAANYCLMTGINLQACFQKISFEYLLALEISKGFQIFIVI